MNRRDEHTLRRAHLLSLLARTPDEQLSAFAKGAGLKRPLIEARARLARDLLDALAAALESNDDAAWRRIELACREISPSTIDEVAVAGSDPQVAKVEAPRALVPEVPVEPSPPTSPQRPWPTAPPRFAPQSGPSPWAPRHDDAPPAPPCAPGALEARAPITDVEGTVIVTALPGEPRSNPLPFGGVNEPPPSAVSDADPHPGLGETAFMPALPDSEATTPFAIPAAAPMPLEHYAALRVDEERSQASERASVYRRHGIEGAEERQRIDQDMGRYLRRDASARAKFEELLARYRAAAQRR